MAKNNNALLLKTKQRLDKETLVKIFYEHSQNIDLDVAIGASDFGVMADRIIELSQKTQQLPKCDFCSHELTTKPKYYDCGNCGEITKGK